MPSGRRRSRPRRTRSRRCRSFDPLQGAGVSRLSRLSVQIRLSDAGYTGYGVTRHEGTKVGMAEKAECHDRGQILTELGSPGRRHGPRLELRGLSTRRSLGPAKQGIRVDFRRVRSGLGGHRMSVTESCATCGLPLVDAVRRSWRMARRRDRKPPVTVRGDIGRSSKCCDRPRPLHQGSIANAALRAALNERLRSRG